MERAVQSEKGSGGNPQSHPEPATGDLHCSSSSVGYFPLTESSSNPDALPVSDSPPSLSRSLSQALGQSSKQLLECARERALVLELLPHIGYARGPRGTVQTSQVGPVSHFTPGTHHKRCRQKAQTCLINIVKCQTSKLISISSENPEAKTVKRSSFRTQSRWMHAESGHVHRPTGPLNSPSCRRRCMQSCHMFHAFLVLLSNNVCFQCHCNLLEVYSGVK